MRNVLKWVSPLLPACKPHHLLGVGEIDDIFTLVEEGFDTFDCVQPTRLARMGRVYCHSGQVCPVEKREAGILKMPDSTYAEASADRQVRHDNLIDILKAEYAYDFDPIEKNCPCYTCQHFTRAYLHHLFKVRELLGYRLATIHNIAFINGLMREIRLAIREGSLVALKESLCLPETKKDATCG
jgi:tRNA-guanine family transglycosylase